jgi:hypothetical protein
MCAAERTDWGRAFGQTVDHGVDGWNTQYRLYLDADTLLDRVEGCGVSAQVLAQRCRKLTSEAPVFHSHTPHHRVDA